MQMPTKTGSPTPSPTWKATVPVICCFWASLMMLRMKTVSTSFPAAFAVTLISYLPSSGTPMSEMVTPPSTKISIQACSWTGTPSTLNENSGAFAPGYNK
eukprot:1349470-Rhodomonas_salina.3